MVTTYSPKFSINPPEFRILWRDDFGADEGSSDQSVSATDWNVLDQPTPGVGGVELLGIHPKGLPEVGFAEFRYIYGKFSGYTIAHGPDLQFKEIRVQLRPYGSGDPDAWTTYFWGRVDVQEESFITGGVDIAGSTVYRVIDGFARTAKWKMDRHGLDGRLALTGGDIYVKAEMSGNPGYNYQLATDGPVLGNRSLWSYSRGGKKVFAHVWQGAFASADPANNDYKWSEWDAMQHALSATRPLGEPFFEIRAGDASTYGMYNPIDVNPLGSVFDFVAALVAHNRGRGQVCTGWLDQGDGSLKVGLVVSPQFEDDIVYSNPATGAPFYGTIIGASTADTKYKNEAAGDDWNVQGDQRLIDRVLQYSDPESNLHDYVETVGEQMQIIGTFSYKNNDGITLADMLYEPVYTKTWAARWSDTDATNFEALLPIKRILQYWDFCWQAHGLPRDWEGYAGDGYTNGAQVRIDWMCADNGVLFKMSDLDQTLASAALVEMQSHMPLYQGYDYTGSTPKKTDNSQEQGAPSPRPLAVYLNLDPANDRWYPPQGQLPSVITDIKFSPQAAGFSPEITLQSDALLCLSRGAMDFGSRFFADVAADAALAPDYRLNALYDVTQLAFTMALKMPYRVRLCSTTIADDYPSTPGNMKDWRKAVRRRIVYVPNAHLWIIDSKAIYDLNQNDYVDEQGFAPRRGALGSTTSAPGILRDDRERLVIYHTMMVEWYMKPRRRIVVGLKGCGFIPQEMTKTVGVTPSTVTEILPKLGNYIAKLTCAGQTLDVGTLVTSIDYDHQRGETVWTTDWHDLEVS